MHQQRQQQGERCYWIFPIDLIRVPAIELSQSVVEFKATRLGERLTQTVTVENPIPDSTVSGKWEVAPHSQDPPHTPNAHAWISVKPAKFACNHTVCHIHVDTSKLMADKLYKRQLLLHTNAYPEIHSMQVQVQTAPLPIEKCTQLYAGLVKVLLSFAIASIVITWSIGVGIGGMGVALALALAGTGAVDIAGARAEVVAARARAVNEGVEALDVALQNRTKSGGMIWYLAGLVAGAVVRGGAVPGVGAIFGAVALGLVGVAAVLAGNVTGAWATDWAFRDVFPSAVSGSWAVSGVVVGASVGASVMNISGAVVVAVVVAVVTALVVHLAMGQVLVVKDLFTFVLLTLTSGLGICFGIGCIVGLFNPYILGALALTGLPLFTMLLYPPFKRRTFIAKYRQSEERLIEP